MDGYQHLLFPKTLLGLKLASLKNDVQVFATPSAITSYDVSHNLYIALVGGTCSTITHSLLTTGDFIRTRISIGPVKYERGLINRGWMDMFKRVVAEEGIGGLITGLGPFAAGNFIQGWFQFGGVEFIKINVTQVIGEKAAWDNRLGIYLGASAIAEVIADIFLCPLEATRIRLVSNPSFADGLCSAAIRVFQEEGLLKGFYSGYGPTLLKQVPFTMAKFTVQGFAAEAMASTFDKSVSELQGGTQWGVSFLSGAVAGVAAAIISHPVDTLLSKVNKVSTTAEGSMMTRLSYLAREMGLIKLCTVGLVARCVTMGALTGGQFMLFDAILGLTKGEKFHFHRPAVEDPYQ